MKKSLASIIPALAAVAALSVSTAFAHPDHDVPSGAIAGLMHPLTGIDHLIALAAVGALFALMPSRARWSGVAALMTALAAGAVVGLAGIKLPGSEWMIALSVLVAGVMLVKSGGTHPALVIGGAALFALFHGYAHGVETTGAATAFVAAFLLSSLAIVLVAMFAARVLVERRALRVATGAGTGAAGLALLALLAA